MAERGSMTERPAQPAETMAPEPPGDPSREEMVSTGIAATIVDKSPRTVERWVDNQWIRGGRPTDPSTGEPLRNARRWVDARHAVAIAVAGGKAHLVPEQWRYLIPQPPGEERHAA